MSVVETLLISDGEGATTVIWASRHLPLPRQVGELRRLLGPIRVVQLSGRIPNAEFIVDAARKHAAKVIVPVLPLSMVARLVELARNYGFEVWWAEMEQVNQGAGKPPRVDEAEETVLHSPEGWKVMRFRRFHRIKAVKLDLEPL